MSGKFALIIGNTEYTDPGLAQLSAPGRDAEDFSRVLKDPDICAFDDVHVLLNEPSHLIGEAIDTFFYQKKPDDLLIVYFSGHGVRDEFGALYLAVKNTNRTRLRATAIRSDYIREAMDQSRSKRQVVILDCCNSGAFPQGTKAETGGMMGMVNALQGYGRFVLTASDATQFAWEGDKIIGETQNSLFTHFLVKGLRGEADKNGDGRITVDELYDYAFDEISKLTPKQTPTKSISKQEGEIVLRQITRIEDIKPVALPEDLISEIEDPRPSVREWAVQRLANILKGKNIGMARSAVEALEKIATDENTTRRVSQMAMQVLESFRQVEQKAEEERRAKEEAERLAALKAEEERLAREKAEAERKAKEEAEKLLRAQAEREAAEQEAARLKAEREAAEKAARAAALKAAQEKAEKEAAEHEEAQRAEREARELASRRRAEREAAEKAEREALNLAARRTAEREEKEQVAERKVKTTRPSWVTFGILGGVIIGLALCGYGATKIFPLLFGGTPTTAVPTRTEVAAITQPPAETDQSPGLVTAECSDALGCVTVGPDEPIHIAYALVISGADETLGIDSRTGIEVAIALKGKVLGHDIQLTGEDDGCSVEVGQATGSKLAADPTIIAVIGTSCSSAARGAVPLLSQAGFVIISPSNTAPDLTRLGDSDQHPGYFRTVYNDEAQGVAAAQFAFERLGVRKAATIHDGSLYAESLQAVFADTFKELGGEITAQEAVDENGTDFKSVLSSIAAGGVDLIYHPIFVNAGGLIINQARQLPGLDGVYLMGGDGIFSPDVVQGAGEAVEGVFVSSPDFSAFSADYESVFLPKYREVAGTDPVSVYHAFAYDAANMIFTAIEKVAVQDPDGTLQIPRQALRDAMYATQDFKGLTGNLACSPTGDCADPKIAVYEYHAGQYPPERIWP